jgi:hypothetical protein
MNGKKPNKRTKHPRHDSISPALVPRQPLQHRLHVRHFYVMKTVWKHVMTHRVCHAPLTIVVAREIHAIHSPVIALMQVIVTANSHKSHSNASQHPQPDAVELRCQNYGENCYGKKCISDFLKLFFTQIVSSTMKNIFTSEARIRFLFTIR